METLQDLKAGVLDEIAKRANNAEAMAAALENKTSRPGYALSWVVYRDNARRYSAQFWQVSRMKTDDFIMYAIERGIVRA